MSLQSSSGIFSPGPGTSPADIPDHALRCPPADKTSAVDTPYRMVIFLIDSCHTNFDIFSSIICSGTGKAHRKDDFGTAAC